MVQLRFISDTIQISDCRLFKKEQKKTRQLLEPLERQTTMVSTSGRTDDQTKLSVRRKTLNNTPRTKQGTRQYNNLAKCQQNLEEDFLQVYVWQCAACISMYVQFCITLFFSMQCKKTHNLWTIWILNKKKFYMYTYTNKFSIWVVNIHIYKFFLTNTHKTLKTEIK